MEVHEMKRTIITTIAVAGIVLAAACVGESEGNEETVRLSNGDVMTESGYQDHLAALIDDLGYATVCHELRLPDDLGESSPEDRERIIVLYREVCEEHAASAR